MPITRDRAERIARAHACVGCREYTYRKFAVREASAALSIYSADAAINGLHFPLREEECAVATFTHSVGVAARALGTAQQAMPLLANWEDLKCAVPAFAAELLEAVALDNEG